MDQQLLSEKIQEFINSHVDADVTKLALKKNSFPDVDWTTILNQITAKQKAKTKLPTWFNTANIIYPNKISIEQTSSEKTAEYKSELVSGASLIDLTGGFGVDIYYFAQKISLVVHCEINSDLSEIVAHNVRQFRLKNVQCVAEDSTEALKKMNQSFTWIYVDPSRRNDAKGKVFMLKDCLPNVPELLDFYFGFSQNILIKTAPILDITAGLSELKNVKAIQIVALENEVKELLWVLEKNYSAGVEMVACNLMKSKKEIFRFTLGQSFLSNQSLPKKYLYEPNAAIMKSGGFDAVAHQFDLEKLQQHSHLYTSEHLIDFPGRTFEIQECLDYNKQNMRTFLEGKKANVTTRNFPETVENIRKKWKIRDGGDLYSFFTTDVNNRKIVLLCGKLN